jgi:hypothetical protein
MRSRGDRGHRAGRVEIGLNEGRIIEERLKIFRVRNLWRMKSTVVRVLCGWLSIRITRGSDLMVRRFLNIVALVLNIIAPPTTTLTRFVLCLGFVVEHFRVNSSQAELICGSSPMMFEYPYLSWNGILSAI